VIRLDFGKIANSQYLNSIVFTDQAPPMTYYAALAAAWNGATQPPTGVTGTGLIGGDTTAQKIAKVNAWTITGTIPTTLYATGDQVFNCLDWTEFAALTAAQQQSLLLLCQIPGLLLGGSANTSKMLDGMLLAYFTNHGGPTISNLTALAKASMQNWVASPSGAGLNGPVSEADTTAAGLS
jgi:hypothetical protein